MWHHLHTNFFHRQIHSPQLDKMNQLANVHTHNMANHCRLTSTYVYSLVCWPLYRFGHVLHDFTGMHTVTSDYADVPQNPHYPPSKHSHVPQLGLKLGKTFPFFLFLSLNNWQSNNKIIVPLKSPAAHCFIQPFPCMVQSEETTKIIPLMRFPKSDCSLHSLRWLRWLGRAHNASRVTDKF